MKNGGWIDRFVKGAIQMNRKIVISKTFAVIVVLLSVSVFLFSA